jgi:hypothetical protein
MAAILDQGAMAYVSLGRGWLQTRDFALSTYESKIPVNFLLFTGSPRFAPSQVVLPRPAASRPQRLPLNAPTPDDCGRHLLMAVLDGLRNLFRERSQLPRTKRPGKTIVKTMFGHEQHDAWPNEPDCFVVLPACLVAGPFKRRRRLQFRPECQGVRAPARQRRCLPAAVQVSGFRREQRGRRRCLLECPPGTHSA